MSSQAPAGAGHPADAHAEQGRLPLASPATLAAAGGEAGVQGKELGEGKVGLSKEEMESEAFKIHGAV